MKKNVWIMNHYAGSMFFDKGGRHYNFAKYLRRSGYEPVIFCANSMHGKQEAYFDDKNLWHEHVAEEINTPFVFVKARLYQGNGKQRVLNMIDFYFNVKKTAKQYAKKHGIPDVIYASSVHPLTLVAGIQLAKYFGVKCICEVRDLWPESIVAYSTRLTKANPLIKFLYTGEKWIYVHADALIFTVEGAYDYIVEQSWEREIPRDKDHYINNGVDLEVFSYNHDHYQIKDSHLQSADIFKIVYIGSIRKVNNLSALLDTAKVVTNPKMKFLIWGDGDERTMLERRVRDERIDNVIFKGKVEKKYIPYIVSCADVNLIHGGDQGKALFRFGISPNKMFDCFAAGKPIIMDVLAKYNPVERWDAGICIDSIDKLPEALEGIHQTDEQTRRVMGERAYQAAQTFDFKPLTQKLLGIIEGK